MKTKIATTAYTMKDGASLPVRLNTLDDSEICDTMGYMATGSPVCCMSKHMANQLGILTGGPDEPFFGKISIGDVGKDIVLWLHEVDEMPYGNSHPLVLGMSFLRHFQIDFDGRGQIATLYHDLS